MPSTPTATIFMPWHGLDNALLRGTRDAQPDAADVVPGTLYCLTDAGYRVEQSDGAAWVAYVVGAPMGAVFPYRADTSSTTASDPGAGYFRWNTVGQIDATVLYLDWLTTDGLDVHLLFQLMTPPSRVLVQDLDFALQYQIWELTAPATNMADWFQVPVALVISGGATFTHNQRLAVIR